MLSAILSTILLLGGRHKSQKPRRRRAPYHHHARPQVESLERRDAPAAFTVNTLADNGAGVAYSGDLRYCITEADNSSDTSSTITFSAGLSGTVVLGTELPHIINGKNITINASLGVDVMRDTNAATNFAIFTIDSGAICTIYGLGIGFGTASGIVNLGNLSLDNCLVSYNTNTNGFGGGIRNSGSLVLNYTTVEYNSASDAAGIGNFEGLVDCYNSSISWNTATQICGGIDNTEGTVYLSNTAVSYNSAGIDAGGIYNSDGTVTMSGGMLTGNTAVSSGGGLYNAAGSTGASFTNVMISYNQTTDPSSGSGGGFYLMGGSAFFYSCTISNNTAGQGNAGGNWGAYSSSYASYSADAGCTFGAGQNVVTF